MSIPAFTAAFQASPPPSNSRHGNDFSAAASWTSSISHCCRNGRLHESISLFNRMRESGIAPNHVTFVVLLSGCGQFPDRGSLLGPSLHGYARKIGLDAANVMVGTALVDMYSKLDDISSARLCFDRMDLKNKVTWNAMIGGYMRRGKFRDALQLFDEMPERDAISWTVVIDGFVKMARFEDALIWFQRMQLAGEVPDSVTITSALSAVANLGTLASGLWLHRYIQNHHFRDGRIRVHNSLIDMYFRCGHVGLALQVFESMPERNVVSWNSVIVGLATSNPCEALNRFRMMQKQGLDPDSVTFTGALTAFSHAGLVDEALKLFHSMKTDHKIVPRVEHYGCLVDLYTRAGRLKEAVQVVKTMPMKPNEVILGSLLAACRASEDIEFAETVINQIHGDFKFVMLSNLYAASGSWIDAAQTRKKMKSLGVQKKPGLSTIEVSGFIHKFMSGDKSHVDTDSIYTILNHISDELKLHGNACETDSWVLDI